MLGGGGDLFGCSESFPPSSEQPVPKPMAPGFPASRAAAMRILGQPGGLESQTLCRTGARCPLGAPLRLWPGRWARASSIIEKKYCSIPRQPARLPFFLPDRGADINVGACCCSASAWAASQRVLPRLLQGGGFLISKFSPFPINLFIPYQFLLTAHYFHPPLLQRGF